MTALTGKSDESSLIAVWENYIAEKKRIGKVGTADTHIMSMKSFMEITGFKKKDGFTIDSNLVRKWEEGMLHFQIISVPRLFTVDSFIDEEQCYNLSPFLNI